MRKLLILAVAAVAVTFLASENASAQSVGLGYNTGVGLNYGYGSFNYPNQGNRGGLLFPGRIGFSPRAEAPPYFAQYPPVYYNGIVSRPYGISPYAAPPGIMPTEMMIMPSPPISISNPHYDGPAIHGEMVAPVSGEAEPAADATANQSTHIINPYVETVTSFDGAIFDN